MRTAVDTSDWKVTCFDATVYLQEKSLVNVTIKESGDYVGDDVRLRVYSNTVAPRTYTNLATYKTDNDGNLTIDVSELLRSGVIDYTIFIDAMNGSVVDETATILWTDTWLINYDFGLIPWTDSREYPEYKLGVSCVTLPNHIIFPDAGTLSAVVYLGSLGNNYLYYDAGSGWTRVRYSETVLPIPSFDMTYTYGYGTRLSEITTLQTIHMRSQDCDIRYAYVQWTSRHGDTKRFVWKVKDVTYTTNDSTSLEVINESYHTLKGQEYSFTIYIDDLTAYDYWYYSDIVTSSDVRVKFTNTTAPTEDDRVDVVTKSVTIPNGDVGEFYKLEVEVKYKHYDVL